MSLITGTFAQSLHFVFCTIQPSSRISTSTVLLHFEQFEEIVKPHFLQLKFSINITNNLIIKKKHSIKMFENNYYSQTFLKITAIVKLLRDYFIKFIE